MPHHTMSAEEVLSQLGTGEGGISAEEALARLGRCGRNELAKEKKKTLARRYAEQLTNPMILVLIAAATISLLIALFQGHGSIHEYAEPLIIYAVVILNAVLGVVQESKAEKAIEALRAMSAATAKVTRGGAVCLVPSAELVVGDIVLLEAGDAVPADMRLLSAYNLKNEEAALTGESVPSDKCSDAIADENISLGDRRNMAYMGSCVAYGRGVGVVTATGMATEMGKIAGMLQNADKSETPLQKRLSQLSKALSAIVLVICAGIFALRLFSEADFTAPAILDSFMLAVALAVAAIPEGLAAVVTIVLSIGVTNMAKRHAIVRKLPAVETLGCTQVICSDKTGTLTQNKMTVVDTYGDTATLAAAMASCCDSRLSPDGSIVGDPTENALVAYALTLGIDKNELDAALPRVAEAPFDSARKMMTTIHSQGGAYIQHTKGAPDEVLRVCTHALRGGEVVPLNERIRAEITEQNSAFAGKALRVLACARKPVELLPKDISPGAVESGLVFIGLAALFDPVRPEVAAAVEECRSAGIRVVMITGDHKDTAAAIAAALGLITSPEQVLTGREIEALGDEEFASRVPNTFVYARVQPEHKVRIVNMWRSKGYVTAMTGDGVNDAPAVKSGDIGIGMGISGTDVTKSVADMVLADDNFATIVAAVAEGRRIYDNIRKTLQFLLSTNLSEIISILAATLAGLTLFKPVHILFINLITDTLPAVALGMEHADGDIMRRPPRDAKQGVFAEGLGFNVLYQGALIALVTLAAFFAEYNADGPEKAMTAAFFTLCMCELFQAVTMRSIKGNVFRLKKQNKVLWGAVAGSLALVLAVIYIPPLSDIFSLEPLGAAELLVSLGLAALVLPLIEIVKAVQRRAG